MKYEHDVIRDLMPLCIDGIASEKSKEAVSEHIAECSDCAKEWDMMQKKVDIDKEHEITAETEQYKKTAKRLRKHSRWILLRVVLCTIAALFAILIIGNYIDGARFTLRGIGRLCVNRIHSDLYETKEEMRNAPKAEYTYLGDVKSSDGKYAEGFMLIEQPDLGYKFFYSFDADRHDLPQIGMWIGWGNTSDLQPIEEDEPIVSEGNSFSGNGNGTFGASGFYAIDKRVMSIEHTLKGTPQILELDGNGFGAVVYNSEAEIPDRNAWHYGKAFDADGKLLYEVRPVTVTENDKERTIYKWVAAE